MIVRCKGRGHVAQALELDYRRGLITWCSREGIYAFKKVAGKVRRCTPTNERRHSGQTAENQEEKDGAFDCMVDPRKSETLYFFSAVRPEILVRRMGMTSFVRIFPAQHYCYPPLTPEGMDTPACCVLFPFFAQPPIDHACKISGWNSTKRDRTNEVCSLQLVRQL